MLRQVLSNPTLVSILNGQMRHIGTACGVWLAHQGYITGSDVETVAGLVMTVGAMVLSALAKKV